MALKDILEDTNITDETEIKIGDKAFTAGELRSSYADPTRYVPRQEYDNLAQAYRTEHQQITNVLTRAANLTEQDMEKEPPARQTPSDATTIVRDALKQLFGEQEGIDYEKDKYVGPAMKLTQQRTLEETTKQIDERLKPLTEQFNNATQFVLRRQQLAEDRAWFRAHSHELPKKPDGTAYKLEEVRQAAIVSKTVDADGWPDWDAVLDKLTARPKAETLLRQVEEAAYQRGFSEARKARGNVVSMFPGGSAGTVGNQKPAVDTKGKSQRQIIDSALEAALQDDDLLGLAGQR